MTEAEILEACRGFLSDTLNLPLASIAPDERFERLGLDSANSAGLTLFLEDLLGRELGFDLVAEHPTPQALAAHLALQKGGAAAS